jgi:hypothetical protein
MATRRVERVVTALESRVDAGLDHETLTALVEADFHRYDAARITDFVPVLVERDVRVLLERPRSARRDKEQVDA